MVGQVPIKFGLIGKKGAVFTRTPHLTFQDGASLEISEEVTISSNQVQVDSYKYHYVRAGGYFFRYEKESTSDAIWKPPEHLHVVFSVPHFNAPFLNLEQVLKLIEVNFYQEGRREKIVGQKIELTI